MKTPVTQISRQRPSSRVFSARRLVAELYVVATQAGCQHPYTGTMMTPALRGVVVEWYAVRLLAAGEPATFNASTLAALPKSRRASTWQVGLAVMRQAKICADCTTWTRLRYELIELLIALDPLVYLPLRRRAGSVGK
jgi:hypothetical protein